MEQYFLILGKRLVKGISSTEEFGLAAEAYEYIEGSWEKIDVNEINDRLMGYDPSEDDMYAMGNSDIMAEIEPVSEKDLPKYMK